MAQYALAQPTLSVATPSGAAAVGEDGELALYCVQPTAIQRFLLDPALCQPGAHEWGVVQSGWDQAGCTQDWPHYIWYCVWVLHVEGGGTLDDNTQN